ncbi:MAG: hypothetical protein ABJZ55_05665, partial [Fuerstiella sp.]
FKVSVLHNNRDSVRVTKTGQFQIAPCPEPCSRKNQAEVTMPTCDCPAVAPTSGAMGCRRAVWRIFSLDTLDD